MSIPSGQAAMTPPNSPPTRNFSLTARNRSSSPRWSMISTLRACRPRPRDSAVRSASRSSTTTPTPCNRNSHASISPVGPPPTTITSTVERPSITACPVPPCPAIHQGRQRRPNPMNQPFSSSPGSGRSFCATTTPLRQGPLLAIS